MHYLLFLKKRQNLKVSSAANCKWRLMGLSITRSAKVTRRYVVFYQCKLVIVFFRSCAFRECSLPCNPLLSSDYLKDQSKTVVIARGCAGWQQSEIHFPANIDTITDATVNHLIELLYYTLIQKNDFTSIHTC